MLLTAWSARAAARRLCCVDIGRVKKVSAAFVTRQSIAQVLSQVGLRGPQSWPVAFHHPRHSGLIHTPSPSPPRLLLTPRELEWQWLNCCVVEPCKPWHWHQARVTGIIRPQPQGPKTLAAWNNWEGKHNFLFNPIIRLSINDRRLTQCWVEAL